VARARGGGRTPCDGEAAPPPGAGSSLRRRWTWDVAAARLAMITRESTSWLLVLVAGSVTAAAPPLNGTCAATSHGVSDDAAPPP
jgi:hypothetical protein